MVGAVDKELFKFSCGYGLTEQASLCLRTAVRCQEVSLNFRFHSFGNIGQTQSVSHGDYRIRDRYVIRVVWDVLYKGLIDF